LRFDSSIVRRLVLVAFIAAALVAVLIPVCAMQLCGPVGSDGMGGMMGMDLGSIVDCEHMYFPSDAPSALIVPVFALLIALAAVFLFAQDTPLHSASVQRFEFVMPDDPDPPGDPLVGRLRL